MIRLILILLGVDYLRRRSVAMYGLGFAFVLAGIVLLVDSLGSYGYFPLKIFAGLLVVAGVCALAMAAVSSGAMRIGRIIEGVVFVLAALLVMAGHYGGDFWLAMILGTLFALDGLLQCLSAVIVRYPRWRLALLGGLCEIAIAVSFFSPYPFGYEGTVPYALSLALLFVGWGMIWIAVRMRLLGRDATVGQLLGAGERCAPDPLAAASTDRSLYRCGRCARRGLDRPRRAGSIAGVYQPRSGGAHQALAGRAAHAACGTVQQRAGLLSSGLCH